MQSIGKNLHLDKNKQDAAKSDVDANDAVDEPEALLNLLNAAITNKEAITGVGANNYPIRFYSVYMLKYMVQYIQDRVGKNKSLFVQTKNWKQAKSAHKFIAQSVQLERLFHNVMAHKQDVDKRDMGMYVLYKTSYPGVIPSSAVDRLKLLMSVKNDASPYKRPLQFQTPPSRNVVKRSSNQIQLDADLEAIEEVDHAPSKKSKLALSKNSVHVDLDPPSLQQPAIAAQMPALELSKHVSEDEYMRELSDKIKKRYAKVSTEFMDELIAQSKRGLNESTLALIEEEKIEHESTSRKYAQRQKDLVACHEKLIQKLAIQRQHIFAEYDDIIQRMPPIASVAMQQPPSVDASSIDKVAPVVALDKFDDDDDSWMNAINLSQIVEEKNKY